MIGKRKLAAIRAELRAAFKSESLDQAWFGRQIRKLERRAKPNATEIETLIMMRDALAEAAPTSMRTRRWFQFTLRTLLLLLVAVGVSLGVAQHKD